MAPATTTTTTTRSPANKKTKKVKEEPIVEETPAPTPVQEKKKTKKKTVPEPEPETVEETPAVQEGGNEEVEVEAEVITYASMHCSLLAHLQGMTHEIKDLMKTVRTMKTMHEKEVKENKNAKKAPRRQRTTQAGFAVPTKISPQLASYIGVNSVDSLSRTEAVKKIHAKIIANNLQNPEDRRIIRYEMDKEFKALLGLPNGFQVNKKGEKDTKLTYFNLQRYISQHFIKE
jgi:chromatin remodeling complex protein RSC6